MNLSQLIRTIKIIEKENGFKNEKVNNLEDLYSSLSRMKQELTKEEINLIYQFIQSNYNGTIIVNALKKILEPMNLKEKINAIIFCHSQKIGIETRNILSQNEKEQALDYLDKISAASRKDYIRFIIDTDNMAEYINKNGKNKYLIMDLVLDEFNKQICYLKETNSKGAIKRNKCILADFAMKLDNPEDIAVLGIKSEIIRDDMIIKVNDEYLSSLMSVALRFEDKEVIQSFLRKIGQEEETQNLTKEKFKSILVDEVQHYTQIKQHIAQMKTEDEKTEFIISLNNKFMKLGLLGEIKEKINRKKIIDSLKNNVSPELEDEVNLAKQMIVEFWKDILGKKFDYQKRERVELVLKMTDIIYDKDSQAIGVHIDGVKEIRLNSKSDNNPLYRMQILLHEYGHALSNGGGTFIQLEKNKEIEEGTQNLFAEMVLNHYINKHGQISLNGKNINVTYPIKVENADTELTAWPKTFMYLQEENGEDYDIIAEYELGNKYKFLTMLLGKEKANAMSFCGKANLKALTMNIVYEANQERLKSINEGSRYYDGNSILQKLKKRFEPDVNDPEL